MSRYNFPTYAPDIQSSALQQRSPPAPQSTTRLPWARPQHQMPTPLPTVEEILRAPRLPSSRLLTGDGGVCIVGGFAVKYGKSVTRNEGDALIYLEQHARELPAPRLYAMFQDPRSQMIFLVMEHVEGVSLTTVWDSLKWPAKVSLGRQLSEAFTAMEEIPHRVGWIGGVHGQDINDPLLRQGKKAVGWGGQLLSNPKQFAVAIAMGSRVRGNSHPWFHSPSPTDRDIVQSLSQHGVKFTHGGLDLDNFLVMKRSAGPAGDEDDEGDGMYTLRAITGWKDAGWYPAYWEYITATGRDDTSGRSPWNEIAEGTMRSYKAESMMYGTLVATHANKI